MQNHYQDLQSGHSPSLKRSLTAETSLYSVTYGSSPRPVVVFRIDRLDRPTGHCSDEKPDHHIPTAGHPNGYPNVVHPGDAMDFMTWTCGSHPPTTDGAPPAPLSGAGPGQEMVQQPGRCDLTGFDGMVIPNPNATCLGLPVQTAEKTPGVVVLGVSM